jgi:hypothetical protein
MQGTSCPRLPHCGDRAGPSMPTPPAALHTRLATTTSGGTGRAHGDPHESRPSGQCRVFDPAGSRRRSSGHSRPGPRVPQSVDYHPESREALPPARVEDLVPGEDRRPVVQNLDEVSRRDLLHDRILGNIGDAEAVQRRIDHGVRGIEGELTLDADANILPVLLDLPGVKPPAPEVPVINAVVPDQLFGCDGAG